MELLENDQARHTHTHAQHFIKATDVTLGYDILYIYVQNNVSCAEM